MIQSASDLSISPSWYVAATHPQKEHIAARHLERQGFKTFLPRFEKVRRHSQKMNIVLASLFPSYIFVSFDVHAQPWHKIRSTFGVRHLLGPNPSRPQVVPKGVIDLLQSRSDNGVIDEDLHHLKFGDQVWVMKGPFAEHFARVESLSDKDRVNLLFHILGSDKSVQIPLAHIKPAPPQTI
jgi:transcription elongation factor/antiterminator RfaH